MSDAYGGAGGYGQATPIGPPPAVKRIDPTMMWVIRVVVIVACFAAGWYATDWVLNRHKSYTSAGSGISFTYPGQWKPVSGSSFSMGAGLTGGQGVNTEVTLADGATDATFNNFLGVAAVASTIDWESAKARWQVVYGTDLSRLMPLGVQVSPATFADLTVAGKPAYSARFTMTYMNVKYDCDITVVQDGGTYHVLAFVAKPPKGTNATFQELLKSVKFGGTSKPSPSLRYLEAALRA